MEQRRYLRCLGQPALFTPTGDPVRFRTKKHLALLIYIAVEHRSHRRDRIAELLWPKASSSEARHSLATALSILRPRLGLDGLETSRDHVRLAPNRVGLDLERLESGDVLGSEITGPLEVAAFLDGFDIPDSAEFTHWKDGQQARLLPMIKDALVVLIDRCRRNGDTRQIEKLADRMLVLDDLSEEAIRAKMEARAFAGDRLTALEIFEGWKRKLADELQAVPSDLVEGIAIRLRRRGWERTTLPKIPNVPTDQWRGRPFIGRSTEYRVLYEAWEDVRRGAPRHALVLGDSGVGKSTLVQRLTTAAGLEGAAISRVQCYDLEREVPYSTLSNLTIGLLDRPGVSATSPDALAEIARTIPEVRRRFPNLPPSTESQGESARIRLTEALLEMITVVAEDHPVILIVDDLHLSDDVSLAVLHLIMRRLRREPVMVLLIARQGELSETSQAARFLENTVPFPLRIIEVLPLGYDDSREMLRWLIPPDEPQPDSEQSRALLRAAAGFPMVLELLTQDWKVSGQESLALSLDAMTADCSRGSAHTAYRQILDRLTWSLDATTRSVLNLAAILGRRLNDFAMYAIVDLSAGQTMTGMAELVRRRVLRDGAQGLEFVNELVRAAAYVSVPPTLRRVLHGDIANRFIESQGRVDEDLGLEIAWHCIRSGRNEEAIPHLLRGSRHAIQSGAPNAAERSLATALPHLTGSNKAEALMLLVEALQERGAWEESLAVLNELETSFEDHPRQLSFILRTKARRLMGSIDSAELAELPTRLLKLMESTADQGSKIRAAGEAVSILNGTYSTAVPPGLIEKVASLDNGSLDLNNRVQILLTQSMLCYIVRDFPRSFNYITDGTTLLLGRHTPGSLLAMFQLGEGAIFMVQGIYSKAIPALRRAYDTAYRIGNDSIYLQASTNLALSFTRTGDYGEALYWANHALNFGTDGEPLWHYMQAAKSALVASTMLGKTSDVELIIDKWSERFVSLGPRLGQAWALYKADIYCMLGRPHEAEDLGRMAISGVEDHSRIDAWAGPYARWVARISFTSGNVERGRVILDRLSGELERFDAIDQADILNARCWLYCQDGHLLPREVERMIKHLEALPPAFGEQLRRMGMLDFC